MLLPRWVPFLVAAWVIAFGVHRLRIAFQKEAPANDKRPNYRRGGYYGRSKRSHAVFGVLYLVLGGICVAMGFGYQVNLLQSCRGEQAQEPAPAAKPDTSSPGVLVNPGS